MEANEDGVVVEPAGAGAEHPSAPAMAEKAVRFDRMPVSFQQKRPELVAQGIEFKGCSVELKADRAKRRVEGWFTGWNIDSGEDQIVKGALGETIAERMPTKLIKYFWQHETGIGMPLKLEEQDGGGWGDFQITNTPAFDKYVAMIEDGTAAHHSIGYSIPPGGCEMKIIPADPSIPGSTAKRIRQINKLKLYEVSAVYWPMNEMATIAGVKSMLGHKSLWSLTEVLDAIRNLQWALDYTPSLEPGEADVARQIIDLLSGVTPSLSLLLTPAEPYTPTTIELAGDSGTAAVETPAAAVDTGIEMMLADPAIPAALTAIVQKMTAHVQRRSQAHG